MKLKTLKDLLDLRERLQGETIALANGCFDMLHAGHISLLREAKSLGTVLVVAVTCDDEVRKQKGETRPIVQLADRLECLKAVRWVDHVVVQEDPTPEVIAEILMPHVLVKGAEYRGTKIPGSESSGRVHFVEMLPGRSTSQLATQV